MAAGFIRVRHQERARGRGAEQKSRFSYLNLRSDIPFSWLIRSSHYGQPTFKGRGLHKSVAPGQGSLEAFSEVWPPQLSSVSISRTPLSTTDGGVALEIVPALPPQQWCCPGLTAGEVASICHRLNAGLAL